MTFVHWDEVDSFHRAKGEMDATWQRLGHEAGARTVGVNRVRVAPGMLPTPPHSHTASEEVFFVLAGSGHIAGVVNPPAVGKYQHWTNDTPVETLDAFIAGATEHPGSWWPHWLGWLHRQNDSEVAATGKRLPGGKGDRVIEDAPGRYVMTR